MSFAALKDPGLARWIDTHVAFPSTMVDRITPQMLNSAERRFVERTFGVADKWPVFTEPYCQWIIEDSFSDGRPPLDEVGAQFVADVSGHKTVKTRLLNGTHIPSACLATLAGYQRTDEAMRDRVIYGYVEQLMRDEIQPLLPAVAGMNTPGYRKTLLDRLSNSKMSDQLPRLARRGSTKISSFLLPSLHEAIAQGRPHTSTSAGSARRACYLRGYDLRRCDAHPASTISRHPSWMRLGDHGRPRSVVAARDLHRVASAAFLPGSVRRDDRGHR